MHICGNSNSNDPLHEIHPQVLIPQSAPPLQAAWSVLPPQRDQEVLRQTIFSYS